MGGSERYLNVLERLTDFIGERLACGAIQDVLERLLGKFRSSADALPQENGLDVKRGIGSHIRFDVMEPVSTVKKG